MQPILKSCCGLDVHKSMVMACIAHGPLDKPPKFEIRKFSTMTDDLRTLKEWLKEYGVTAVAMESTGIYWKTIFNILAEMAKGKLKRKVNQLVKARNGNVTDHHRFLLKQHLAYIDCLVERIREIDEEIQRKLQPYEKEFRAIQSVTGIKEISAASVIAEIGVDMSRFPDEAHLSSWAAMCPGNNAAKRFEQTFLKFVQERKKAAKREEAIITSKQP